MDNLLVSVIVPCYNQGRYLAAALDSILEQSYTNWECIMVNDGSTDITESIAQQYLAKDSRFRYIPQSNKGLSNARNTGLKVAKGRLIQFLDADDLIEKDKINTAISIIIEKGLDSHIVVYSSMRYFEDKHPNLFHILGRDKFIAHIELKDDDTLESQREVIRWRNPFVISAPLYPAGLFKSIGLFDEQLTALEDWDLHIRCISGGYRFHHHYVRHSRTLIRLHDSSMMRDQKLLDVNYHQLNIKHNLMQSGPVANAPLLHKIIRNITPPVIMKIWIKAFRHIEKLIDHN